MLDAANLSEELRKEQDRAVYLEKEGKEVEAKVRELHIQVDEEETSAMKWGEKMVSKLDMRIRELEMELDTENRKLGDVNKNLRKMERGIKEQNLKWEEARNHSDRMRVS